MKITVINKHHGKHTELPNVVSIMRPSALGNPYVIGEGASRMDVIADFDVWLEDQLKASNQEVINAMDDIATKALSEGGVHLLCCCSPLPCHGQVIARYITNALNGREPWDH